MSKGDFQERKQLVRVQFQVFMDNIEKFTRRRQWCMQRKSYVFRAGVAGGVCHANKFKEHLRGLASCKCELCDLVASFGMLIVHDAERLVELTREDEVASLQLGLAVKLAEVKPYHNALNKLAAVRTHSGVLGWNEKRVQWMEARCAVFAQGFKAGELCLPSLSALRRGLQVFMHNSFDKDAWEAMMKQPDQYAIYGTQSELEEKDDGGLLALTDLF